MTLVVLVIPCYGGKCLLMEQGAFIGNGALIGIGVLTCINKIMPGKGMLIGRNCQ